MSLVKTDWVCVLSSGNTIDGRSVSDQMIDDMVSGYDKNTYNARINIEHQTWGMRLGSVEALKSDVVDGVKKMYAVLSPNDYFLSLIQAGQKLHTSVEIQPNFAGTGKSYLIGLALTDSPASLGTTELKLSHNGSAVQAYSTNEVIEVPSKPDQSLFSLFKKEPQKMDKDTASILNQLSQQMNQTAQLLASAEQKLSAHIAPTAAPTPPATEQTAAAELTKLTDEVAALKLELSELKTALSNTSNEPHRDPAAGTDAFSDIGSL